MKKKKKITRPAGKRPETTRCDGVTTYYRKGKVCHCSSKRFPGSSEERDRRCAARTLNQRQRANVFALVSRLVKILTRKLQDLNAWVSLAKTTNMTPANLCHKVNGKPVESGEPSEDMSITVGQELTATIEVTAENGTVKTYTLTVTVNQ